MPVFSFLGIRQRYVNQVQGGKCEANMLYPVPLEKLLITMEGGGLYG
jgi:hypothetical protein